MTDNGRGEDELEKLEGLDEIDVTECAEDNERLKVKFQEKTRYDKSQLEGWMTSDGVTIRESSQQTTAIVVKLNSGEGSVRFFKGKDYQDVGARETGPNEPKRVKMVFLSVGYSCWQMSDASVKYITYVP